MLQIQLYTSLILGSVQLLPIWFSTVLLEGSSKETFKWLEGPIIANLHRRIRSCCQSWHLCTFWQNPWAVLTESLLKATGLYRKPYRCILLSWVAKLAFLMPNFTILAFFGVVWNTKLPFGRIYNLALFWHFLSIVS